MKETTVEKAFRIAGTVREVPARVYWVQGDHGTYLVVLGGQARFCSCPAGQQALGKMQTPSCSHVKAAAVYQARKTVPADVFEGIGAHGGKR